MLKRASIAAVLIAMLSMVCYAADSTSVVVNGDSLNCEVIVKDDRVYVPLRAVSESLGATVSWDDTSQTASVDLANENDLSAMIADVSQSVVGIVGNCRTDSTHQGMGIETTSHGTGVIIKSGGEILTNAHVVKNLEQIIVVMSDGLGYEARLKYIDETIDLAVIKIDRIGLKPIRFAAPESIMTGQTVVAIGTPISFSLRNSASKGIISSAYCSLFSDYRLLQTDAAINPGNSGGPLVNTRGELVGINSSKFSSVDIEGMGFAIPVDTVTYTIKQFETYGRVRRCNTGLDLEESWASRMDLPTLDGLTVTAVAAGSAGQTAGIMAGDVIMAIAGQPVHSMVDYNEAMKVYTIGDQMEFTISRNGTMREFL